MEQSQRIILATGILMNLCEDITEEEPADDGIHRLGVDPDLENVDTAADLNYVINSRPYINYVITCRPYLQTLPADLTLHYLID